EEVIMRVQGYVMDLSLPPVRHRTSLSYCGRSKTYIRIPRNTSRIVHMKQTITLCGLGAERFDCAVRGISTIYQMFKNHVERHRFQLREWSPGADGYYNTLTFSNRYLTSLKEADGDPGLNLGDVVDPFNVLRPLLRNLVHTQENVVKYWRRQDGSSDDDVLAFERIKPDLFATGHLIEVQVAFHAVRVSRAEYVFLPKLRALCLLDRTAEKEYNAAAIRAMSSKPVSPLKKVKRKVGYEAVAVP
ncbi:hypothetical protein C8Q76DRAFT_624886, partial [Earliella scabrosa]